MKLFTKVTKQKEIDPRSHSFTDFVMELLEKHGITDKRKKNECALKMFRKAIHFFRVVMKDDMKASDEEIVKLETELREILTNYGVTGEEEQEEIISEYFIKVQELAG